MPKHTGFRPLTARERADLATVLLVNDLGRTRGREALVEHGLAERADRTYAPTSLGEQVAQEQGVAQ